MTKKLQELASAFNDAMARKDIVLRNTERALEQVVAVNANGHTELKYGFSSVCKDQAEQVGRRLAELTEYRVSWTISHTEDYLGERTTLHLRW